MGSPSRKLPLLVHLPSGTVVRLARPTKKPVAPVASETLDDQLAALSGVVAELTHDNGARVDLAALSLEDFHVVRTVALALGLLTEEPVKRRCLNCEEILEVALSAGVPLGPILDGELDDSEYDEPFDFAGEHPLTRATNDDEDVPAGTLTARLSRLTVAEASELWAVLGSRDRRRLARRMGITRLGDATDPRRIARKIDKLDDEMWERLLDLFEAAHYTPRLTARIVCISCDAENTFLAPRVREFPELADATEPLPEPPDMQAFPSPDQFFAAVEEHGARCLDELGIAAIPIIVEQGVPHVDDGGVPLLGSYTPPPEHSDDRVGPSSGEVRLYYRTFRNQWLDGGPYDVEAEIAETIEHELEHHQAFLRGWDETDAEERALIVQERQRVRGRTETRRTATTPSTLLRTWPLLAILLLLLLLTYLERTTP